MYNSDELANIQVQLELAMRSAGVARFSKKEMRHLKAEQASKTTYYSSLINSTLPQLCSILCTLVTDANQKRKNVPEHITFVETVGYEKTAYVGITSIIDIVSADDKTPLATILHKVGQRLVDEYKFSNLHRFAPQYVEIVKKNLAQRNSNSYTHQRNVLNATASKALSAAPEELSDNQHDAMNAIEYTEKLDAVFLCKLGAFVLDAVCLCSDADGELLFIRENIKVDKRDYIQLLPNPNVADLLADIVKEACDKSPEYMPCVVPPRDWTTPFNGGYHVPEVAETVTFIKTNKRDQRLNPYSQCKQTYDAVNKLQKVPFRVNKDMLACIEDILATELELGVPQKEPYIYPESPITNPALADLKGKELMQHLTPKEKEDFIFWKREVSELRSKNKKRAADLLKVHQTLKVAKKYADFKEIFFVYTVDFRQRVNLCSSFLSLQSNDMGKSLLQFAREKALKTNAGAFWYFAHGADLLKKSRTGQKLTTLPFKDRVRYMVSPETITEMCEIAQAPLDNIGWLSSDKPFQFLAFCFDVLSLVDHVEAGNDFRTFKSRMAVAQDGSCSGTQHYSISLRDRDTAKNVNLTQAAAPNDIYETSAKVFREFILRDLEEAAKYPREVIHQKLKDKPEALPAYIADLKNWLNHTNRDVCKLPTMTFVYKSTIRSCIKTTGDYLKDIIEKEERIARANNTKVKENPTGFEDVRRATVVGAVLLREAVVLVQKATRRGMDYISTIAAACGRAGRPVMMVAPTGFLVRHAVYKTEPTRVTTQLLGNCRIRLSNETLEFNDRSMGMSAPPHNIHLLDSSHLIYIADSFIDENHDMIVIHDSFASHACDTSRVRRTYKNCFIKMYENFCPYETLRELNQEFNGMDLSDVHYSVPEKGDLDINEIKKARFACS